MAARHASFAPTPRRRRSFPSGQFGTRASGGKDHASPRYIFTRLQEVTRLIFPAADDPLLDVRMEDGEPSEPEHYVPIVPMVRAADVASAAPRSHFPSPDIVACPAGYNYPNPAPPPLHAPEGSYKWRKWYWDGLVNVGTPAQSH